MHMLQAQAKAAHSTSMSGNVGIILLAIDTILGSPAFASKVEVDHGVVKATFADNSLLDAFTQGSKVYRAFLDETNFIDLGLPVEVSYKTKSKKLRIKSLKGSIGEESFELSEHDSDESTEDDVLYRVVQ